MAEKQSAERAGDKPDAERGKSREGADRRIEFGEERFIEDEGGGGTVDKKIIPFERRPDGRGKRHPGERSPPRACGRFGIADRHRFALSAPAAVCAPHVFTIEPAQVESCPPRRSWQQACLLQRKGEVAGRGRANATVAGSVAFFGS